MPLIHKRFEKQVMEKGDEIALVASDVTLTYNQLDEKANIKNEQNLVKKEKLVKKMNSD